MNRKLTFLLCFTLLISLFFNIIAKYNAPPAFNADEAAFGYNAYSLLATGKDEYGTAFPLRMKSFGDYKMPLYSYLSVPFIALFGLNEFSSRALNTLIAILFPMIIYFLAKEIFNDVKIALIAAFLSAFSLGLHIIGRHAHEAYTNTFFLSLSLLFLLRVLRNSSVLNTVYLLLFTTLALFNYQSSRLFALLFLAIIAFYTFSKKKGSKLLLVYSLIIICVFSVDLVYKPERVKNLIFFNNPGFTLKINELRGEGGNALLYNKVTTSMKDVLFDHLSYFSPQFLVSQGDENPRFGYQGISYLTVVEYLFFFIGLYFLFHNKERWRYLLLILILYLPLSASLSWAKASLTRSHFLLVPLLLISGYGMKHLYDTVGKRYKILFAGLCAISFLIFSYYSWDFYLFHYPKRAYVIRAWQSGYKELANYVKKNYYTFDKFYITKENGQPYIFMLFYLAFDPSQYQKQATLSKPDEYGFGQIEGFDKFTFSFIANPPEKKYVLAGIPDDFKNHPELSEKKKKIKVIKAGSQEVFWILEVIR